MINNIRNKRFVSAFVLFLSTFIFFILALVKYQILDTEKYTYINDRTSFSSRKVVAARGVILDRNGSALVTNRQGNTIIFDYDTFPSYKKQEERNAVISALIKLFERAGEKWDDVLPIEFNKKGEPQFKEKMDTEIKFMKSPDMLRLNEYATAKNCYDALVERYKLEEYEKKEQIKVMSVCFSMKYQLFSEATPYIFARDVSTDLVSIIKENSDLYKGVDFQIESYRMYKDGTLAPHILGFVGAISADEYNNQKEELKSKLSDANISKEEKLILENNKYELNDVYGKSGIESYAEKYLRGTNGIMLSITDALGDVTTEYSVVPEQGNTVVTTIDAGLQKAAGDALQKTLDSQKDKTIFSTAGALIVIDIKTAAILASVSNPTYDISKYSELYSELIKDNSAPLWNRAFMSTYAPGSTMKPAIAIAALTEGTITPSTVYRCSGSFRYLDTTFTCLASHGSLNVRQSLRYSCNIFYYNAGKDLGIEKMNYYCNLLGLGQKTGVELPEEKGLLAGKATREAAKGVWYPGDTVQAAIGQSDNLFTPLQLVSYCATIANSGIRCKPYIIDSVFSADMNTLVYETKPEITQKIDFSKKNLDIVKAGMRDVVTLGGCSTYFKNCVVEAAAKTGTSQVYKRAPNGTPVKTNNGFVIAFAPYENPEIAAVVVCENVQGGSAISGALAEVFNYYFTSAKDFNTPTDYNKLIA